MDLDVVLNELSIQSPAPNVQTARCWMLHFIHTLKAAASAGVRRNLRTYIDLNSTALANDYTLVRWRNDNDVDLEARRYFKSMVTKYPPMSDLPEAEQRSLSHDFFHQGNRAYGLGVASLLDSLAISFASNPIWNSNKVDLNTDWLDDDGKMISDTIHVRHASQPFHINHLTPWIKDRLRTGVQDGVDLWNRRGDLFPSLSFCEHIGKDLVRLQSTDPILRQIIKKLFEMENYCKGWQEGPFNPDHLSFKITGESKVTTQKYPEARTFLCPDGEERIFTWHCRLTPCAWRMYFDPSAGPGRIYIGNIGPKPPSVNDPT